MLELISASRSLLVGDLLGSVSSLAGLGGNFLGLVGHGEIAFLASLFGALGGKGRTLRAECPAQCSS